MTNVELLREFWQTWEAKGGAGLVERYEEFFTDDAEWRPPMRELTDSRYIGREGLAQYVKDIAQVLSGLEGELEEISEIAPNVVRSMVRIHATAKMSGMTIDAQMIGITRIRDGRVDLAWASYDPDAAQQATDAIVRGEPVPG